MSLIEPFSLLNLSSTITILDLSDTSEIPDSIGNLLFLEIIHIGGCNFTGKIPASIGNLSKATKIVFRSNQFTGQLPYQVSGLSYLATLDLSDNSLQGRVPSWLFTLPSLNYIDLSQNKFTGPIDQFQSLNSLEEVHLEENQMHGTIPSSLFQLVNLTDLDLSSNDLSGTVRYNLLPELKNLRYLDLSNNSQLSFISSSNVSIRYLLPSPWKLRFSYCNITEFPGFLRNSEKLEFLDLSNNIIHEQHPWKYITVLNLRNNTIQGTIPIPPPSTRAFLFSNNKLFGQIPPSSPSLSSLEYLSLTHNNLSGTIPPCLGNFSTQLTILHLNNNNLQGRIPDAFANGSCSLKSLDLNSNKLEGPFPRYLADCDELEVVNVGNNMIGDTCPCWLGSLPELKILVLRSNRFYGPLCLPNIMLPFEALRIIDLSHNEFTGFLPRWIFVILEAMKNVDEKGSDGLYM
ncbi:receptor-like protein 12 [Citrus clementina]|uniref:receptor-like protein 12 n=1 Tax=Citrus clementina TaxID=85681 RepID=UPI000CED39EB|nr:receptor-like protein 12 [Citrus x clementina]